MFGLISAGVSLAGLGMSAMQAIKANRDQKAAAAESAAALNKYENLSRPNAFAALQAPDVSSLSYDRNQRMMAQGADVLAQSGAEGAIGGAANLLQAGHEANLQAAQDQAQANYARDLVFTGEESAIDKEAIGRKEGALESKINMAQQEKLLARQNQMDAIAGMVGGLGDAVGFAKQDFDPATGKYDAGKRAYLDSLNKPA